MIIFDYKDSSIFSDTKTFVKEMFEKDATSLFFDKNAILKLLEEHKSGIKNNGRKIYNIYTFLIWYDVYFGENSKWVS